MSSALFRYPSQPFAQIAGSEHQLWVPRAGGPAPLPGPITNDPGIFYSGTAGNDSQGGTSGDDGFDYSQGGNDSLDGFEGADEFYFGDAFDKLDSVNGGTGHDILFLDGEYDAPVDPFLATTLTNVEEIRLARGHFYRFGMNDGNVAAGQTLIVDARDLRVDDGFGFFGQAETDGAFLIHGSKGGDGLFVGQGADVVNANGGDDVVWCPGGSLSLKTLNGGSGHDTVAPKPTGDAFMTLTNTTMKNFERILLQPEANLGTINVSLTLADGNVAAGLLFEVNQQGTTGTTVNLTFDGSAETNGRFEVNGFGGDDMLIGGSGADFFNTFGFGGGTDQVFGNGGADLLMPWETFDASDIFDGGQGNDTLELRGDYSGGLTFAPGTIASVETIRLLNVGTYVLTLDDANIAADRSLTIDASGLFGANVAIISGAADADGHLTILGGFAGDTLIGSGHTNDIRGGDGDDTIAGGLGVDILSGEGGNDHIIAGDGADILKGGGGFDEFEIGDPGFSTGRQHDEIIGFDADKDILSLVIDVAIDGVDTKVTGGTLSNNGNFNDQLEAAIGPTELGKHNAVLFEPGAGDFAGELFLIIDANGKRGYQANKDFVILLTDPVHIGNLDPADFGLAL